MRWLAIFLVLALSGVLDAQERFRLNSPEAAAAYLRDAASRSGVGRLVTLPEWPATGAGSALAVAEWVTEDGILTRRDLPRDLVSVLRNDGCTLHGLRYTWVAVVEGVDDADRRVLLGFAGSQPATPTPSAGSQPATPTPSAGSQPATPTPSAGSQPATPTPSAVAGAPSESAPPGQAAGRPVGRSFAVVKLAFGDGIHELNIVPVSRNGPARRSLEVVLAAEPREPQVPGPGAAVSPEALDRAAPGTGGVPAVEVRPPPPPRVVLMP